MRRPQTRFAGTASRCEVCRTSLRPHKLRGGGVLHECPECGHLERLLEDCPARHRDAAYGGDPGLDAARLWITYHVLNRRGAVPRRVFELGFGGGALLRRFLDDGASVSGADPEQLGVAIDPEVLSRGRLWRAPIEEIDLAGDEVDLVYGIHVIEHVADVERTLRVALRLLRPGGRLALFTPAGDSLGLRWFGSAWWLLEDPTHVRFFSARSIRRACKEAGFGDVRIRRLWLDNLTMEGASVARFLRVGSDDPGGVLASRWGMALALLAAPVVIVARGFVPRLRPTLYVEAEK